MRLIILVSDLRIKWQFKGRYRAMASEKQSLNRR